MEEVSKPNHIASGLEIMIDGEAMQFAYSKIVTDLSKVLWAALRLTTNLVKCLPLFPFLR